MRALIVACLLLWIAPAAAEDNGDGTEPSSSTVFPIAGEARAGIEFDEGQFKAFRPGRKPGRGCGKGHCGVDLSAPQGAPVLAVSAGVVAQVERSARGHGGRWVRIQHPDGTATWYMHLAKVREGLVTGRPVIAGELLGTLGRTGVTSSPTHLHFALSAGKPRQERYLDPRALLGAAELLAEPTRSEGKIVRSPGL